MSLDQALADLVRDAVRAELGDLTGARKVAYSVPEAAWALGVSADTVRILIDTGRLPLVPHVGRRRLIPVAALEAFAAGAMASTASLPPAVGAIGPADSTDTARRLQPAVSPLASPAARGSAAPTSTARRDTTPPAA